MSLATDILKHKANLSPPAPVRAVSYRGVPKLRTDKKTKPEPVVKPEPEFKHIPGIQVITESGKTKFRAYYYDGSRTLHIGSYMSQERAFAALRLYKLWKRRGMEGIPNKPSFRLYNRTV